MNNFTKKQLAFLALITCLAGLLSMTGSSCDNSQEQPNKIRLTEIMELPSNADYFTIIEKFDLMPSSMNQEQPNKIRLREIMELPSNADYFTITEKFDLMPSRITCYWLFCPAAEGGEYVFLFVPTNEVASSEFEIPSEPVSDLPEYLSSLSDVRQALPLIAVVKVDNRDDLKAGKGIYVLPKTVAGKTFTGFKEN